MVAIETANHFLTAFIVKLGTPMSWSFLIALTSVDAGGEKKTLMQVFNYIFLVSHVVYAVCMVC